MTSSDRTPASMTSGRGVPLAHDALPGVALVPRIRPLGFGGGADILAQRRHNRLQRDRSLRAA